MNKAEFMRRARIGNQTDDKMVKGFVYKLPTWKLEDLRAIGMEPEISPMARLVV